jgi:hypothetical protein
MSRQQAQLIEGLKNLGRMKPVIIPATVVSSKKENATIEVLTIDGLTIPNVRLQSVIMEDNDGVITFPLKDSSVLIARINDSDYYVVVSMETAETIQCRIGERYIQLDEDGLGISNGDDSLKQCLDDLLDEIVTIYAPMNKAAFADIKTRLAKLLK